MPTISTRPINISGSVTPWPEPDDTRNHQHEEPTEQHGYETGTPRGPPASTDEPHHDEENRPEQQSESRYGILEQARRCGRRGSDSVRLPPSVHMADQDSPRTQAHEDIRLGRSLCQGDGTQDPNLTPGATNTAIRA